MAETRDNVCGADIQKRFLIATILSRNGTRLQERFGTDSDNLLKFRDWVMPMDVTELRSSQQEVSGIRYICSGRQSGVCACQCLSD